MIDILELAKEYGVPTAIGLFASGLGGKALLDQGSIKSEIKAIKSDIESVHDKCHIPSGAIEDLKADVEILKRENTRFETRLESFAHSIEKIDSKLDRLIDFHMNK